MLAPCTIIAKLDGEARPLWATPPVDLPAGRLVGVAAGADGGTGRRSSTDSGASAPAHVCAAAADARDDDGPRSYLGAGDQASDRVRGQAGA